jgi:hypothetical protein
MDPVESDDEYVDLSAWAAGTLTTTRSEPSP